MKKKYVTIVRVENPNGPVTVNEQYVACGTCRRYEIKKLSGSVEYRYNNMLEVEKLLKDHARVKNMKSTVSIYKLKGKYKETDLIHYNQIENWEFENSFRKNLIAEKQGIDEVWMLKDNEWVLVHRKYIGQEI